jgi:nucleoside-diphosphate-sugar epimerase
MNGIRNRNTVLIGGAGFIGHNLALALKRSGANVSVIDSLQINNLLTLASARDEEFANRDLYTKMIHERLNLLYDAGVPLYVQDARDYHLLSRLLNKIDPEIVVLLAAVSHASRSNKDPYSTFDHSLRTLENSLDWARQSAKLRQFIYFSSSMVYGNFKSGAVDENTPCEPLGIYGALKFAGEKIVLAYNQVFGLPYTIVRPSALYGARCVSRRVGQIFIENALMGLDIVVQGSEAERLDFTYIDDLVHGIIRCMESEKAVNQTFNLTYGRARSVGEMVEILKRHFPGVNVRRVERDSLTPERGTLSVDKAQALIGYEPRFPLEEGYARYIDWYKKFFRGYTYNARIARSLESTGDQTLGVYSGFQRNAAAIQPQVNE